MSQELLHQIYYNPSHPASFSSCQRLYSALNKKIPKKDIKNWLKHQLTYTLHARKRKHYKRDKYLVDNISEQWQTDLIDLRSIASENDGFNFIVVIIDIFSKYAWTVPIKRKTPDEIIRAFETIFHKTDERPIYLVSDRGKEYVNQKFQKFLKKRNIIYYSANNDDTKACIAERFVRTIKELIFKYMTSRNTLRYVNVLDDLTSSYNNRYHSSIGMTPSQVNPKNILEVWNNLNKFKRGKTTEKFKVGEYVRVSKQAHIFAKGYLPNFSDEIFIVKQVLEHESIIVYKLKDLMEEDIEGTFYEEELQAVIKDDNTVYRVDKILKTRKNKGRSEVFVEWKGWPSKFNSWIPYTNIYN